MAYGPRFEEALLWAARLHRDQVRKGTAVPYVTHLLAVAGLVGEAGGTEDEVIAALLHDAVEDQGGAETRERIRREFGEAVAEIVDECSDTDEEPKPPWRARKEAYIARLRTGSAAALRISVADKLHNARCVLTDLREIGDAAWDKFKGGRDGSLWYYRSLLEIYRSRDDGPQARELERVVSEIEAFSAA